MTNTNISVKGNVMTITVNLASPTKTSASGKSQVIASTQGNQPIAGPKGTVYVGVNVYEK